MIAALGLESYPVLTLEALLTSAAILLAFLYPRLADGLFSAGEAVLARIAARHRLAIVVSGLLPVVLRLLLLPGIPPPKLRVHDEYSYILAGDTFAHGRLANPPHPMWVHFESMHTLQQPTYASMEPPGQRMFLAAGQVLFGTQWAGVLLSVGLMCATACWMLQGWFTPGWALFGSLIFGLRVGVLSYWTNSYWGGAVAAIGGALVFGMLPRLPHRWTTTNAIVLALGLAILANTRPYEGFLVSLPVGGAVMYWLWKHRGPERRAALARCVVPGLIVLAVAALWMGYYNWRVTGNALLLPHVANRTHYAIIPTFVWESFRPIPSYHHAVLRNYYADFEAQSVSTLEQAGLRDWLTFKLEPLWLFFIGPVFTVPLLVFPFAIWRRPMAVPLLSAAAMAVGSLVVVFGLSPHYLAPLIAVVVAFGVEACRQIRSYCWNDKPVGMLLCRGIAVVCLVMVAACGLGRSLGKPLMAPVPFLAWYSGNYDSWQPVDQRQRILKRLEDYGGKHLVLVRYRPDHDVHHEWVYNGADIDGSQAVFAREMDAASNQEIISYYAGRHVWLLEPDEQPPKISACATGPSR